MDFLQLSILTGLVICFGILIFLLVLRYKQKQDKTVEIKKMSNKKHNYMYSLYKVYVKVPFLRTFYLKLQQQIKILYPADTRAIMIKTTKIMTKAVLSAIACLLTVCICTILFDGDIYYMAAGTYLTYVLFTAVIHQSYIMLQRDLVVQFGNAMDCIIHYYHETGIMETALENAINEVPAEIGLHLDRIHKIVTSPRMKDKMAEYEGSEPNKIMLLFLYICASIKEYGDTKLENGQGLFVTSLGYLKEEINIQRNEDELKASCFRHNVGLALFPALLIKPLIVTALYMFPEVSGFFKGIYGTVITVGVFVVCAICYNLVILLRDGIQEVDKEHDQWSKWANDERIRPYLDKYLNIHYKKYEKYDRINKGIGDRTGPRAFLLKRIAFGCGMFLLTIMVLCTSSVTKRTYLKNDFSDSLDVGAEDTDLPVLEDVAKTIMNRLLEEDMSPSEVYNFCKELISNRKYATDDYINSIINTAKDRLTQYQKTKFYWWYLIIALGIGTIGFQYPVFSLKQKKKVAAKRRMNEVMRFQSLLLVLMNIKGMTVPIILEWMESFSNAFKDSIIECRINLPQGQQKALNELKVQNRDCAPFCSIVDNMLSVDKVGIRKAFNEIAEDRRFYVDNRKIKQDEEIRGNGNTSSNISLVPLMVSIVGCYIIPVGIYAYQLYQSMNIM